MYKGEPHNVSANDVEGSERAKPKSAIFNVGNEGRPTMGMSGSLLALMTRGESLEFAKN
jgi:hypothetical protein